MLKVLSNFIGPAKELNICVYNICPMKANRGMGRKSSTAITARFTNEETKSINNMCDEIGIARSIFIHDAVVAAIEKAKA